MGVDDQWRTFSPWSHTVTMMFTQVAHSVGLNDVCDALDLHRGPLSAIRGATPPSRNNLSHANQIRDAQMAEQLFWSMLEHLQSLSPSFARGREGAGAFASISPHDPCGGFHHYRTDRLVSGLGQTSPSQGGRQMSPAAQSPNLPAQLRHHRHRPGE